MAAVCLTVCRTSAFDYPKHRRVLILVQLLARPLPDKPVQPGGFEAGFPGFADGFAAVLVFVVASDVADAGVQPDGVVAMPNDRQLGAQSGRVSDREEVRVL